MCMQGRSRPPKAVDSMQAGMKAWAINSAVGCTLSAVATAEGPAAMQRTLLSIGGRALPPVVAAGAVAHRSVAQVWHWELHLSPPSHFPAHTVECSSFLPPLCPLLRPAERPAHLSNLAAVGGCERGDPRPCVQLPLPARGARSRVSPAPAPVGLVRCSTLPLHVPCSVKMGSWRCSSSRWSSRRWRRRSTTSTPSEAAAARWWPAGGGGRTACLLLRSQLL